MSELMKSGGWNPLAGCWPLYKCRFSLLCIMRLAELKRFAHLRFMGEPRTCRSISYITDYCSVNDIYSDESFPIEYYTWRTSTDAKDAANYDAAMILFMGFATHQDLCCTG